MHFINSGSKKDPNIDLAVCTCPIPKCILHNPFACTFSTIKQLEMILSMQFSLFKSTLKYLRILYEYQKWQMNFIYSTNLLIIVISPCNISWFCDLCCFVVIYLDGQFMHFMMPIMYAIPNLVNKRGIAKRQTSSFKW